MLAWTSEGTFVLQYFHPHFLTRFKPELDAVLHFLLYRFSVWRDVPSPGNQLQNICYRSELPALDAATDAAMGADASALAEPPSSSSLSQRLRGAQQLFKRFLGLADSAPSRAAEPTAGVNNANNPPLPLYPLTRRQKLLYGVLFIGARWGWTRLNAYMVDENWGGYPQVRCDASFSTVERVLTSFVYYA